MVGMKNIFVVELTLGIAFKLEMYLHKPTRPLQGAWKWVACSVTACCMSSEKTRDFFSFSRQWQTVNLRQLQI